MEINDFHRWSVYETRHNIMRYSTPKSPEVWPVSHAIKKYWARNIVKIFLVKYFPSLVCVFVETKTGEERMIIDNT